MKPRSNIIAILLPDLRAGGAERMRIQLAREWIARGFQVEFVLQQAKGELLALLPEGAAVISLDARRLRNAVGPLVRYLKMKPPDVLLAAMWPLTTVALVSAKVARFGGKVLVSDHTALSMSPQTATLKGSALVRTSMRLTYPWAFARIGVSRGVVDDLSKLSGLPQSLFTVIHNPAAVSVSIDNERTMPACMSNPKAKQILAVGTLKPEKEFGLLLRAFDKLRMHTAAHLTILGEGDERPRLETLIKELQLEEAVSLPGGVLDTSPFYAAADLFVLSSRFEGFGNVIVEALSHGIPVVATDCHSGPREILCDGRYGVLVPVGDAAALAEGMARAINQPMKPGELRARAADFDPARIADEYLRTMELSE